MEAVPRPKQLVGGGEFALDHSQLATNGIWGLGSEVLWSAGESLMLHGPQGTGKTTLAQQLALRRAGLRTDPLLGYPVAPSDRKVLYLAMDRPRQIARSLRRMVAEDDRAALDERLIVWRGPLPWDLTREPGQLVGWALHEGFGTVFVDSLKDLATNLADTVVGATLNHAFQLCLAEDVEVVVNHHPRKATADNPRPKTLDDVYGSTWLTVGCGSVVLLWGAPGDEVLEFAHLKQPAEVVGPFHVVVDHETGTVTRDTASDPLAIVRAAGPIGVTAQELAVRWLGIPVTPAKQRKAQRKLQRLEQEHLVARREGGTDENGRRQPDRFVAPGPATPAGDTPGAAGPATSTSDSQRHVSNGNGEVTGQGQRHEPATHQRHGYGATPATPTPPSSRGAVAGTGHDFKGGQVMDDKKEWTEQDEAEAARIDAEPEPDDDELERAISEAIAERDAEE